VARAGPWPVTAPGPRVSAGSGAAFAVQKLVNKKLPYSLQWSLLLAGAAGSLTSYVVTRAETRKCADFWIYLETGKSPQELAVAGRVSQPAGMFTSLPAAFPGLVMPVSSLLRQFAAPDS
ncbi:PREDICTED: transmembrane protein 141, partial [Haliaeetus leucocephalus]|uniref:transmembrane protein 141 n=1 Tax=Haliaeetus leucocephalus TaxID=52644 RepID=UPI00053CB164